MVQIALDVARAHLNRGDPNESTILLAVTELHSCYQCLSTGQGASSPEHSRRFASLYVALETTGVWNLSALSRNFTLFRNWPRWPAANQPCLGPTETKISVVRWQGWGVGGRSLHNRGNWYAGVAEVRRAASSSSLDVSGIRERIIWLRCFIPLVTCVYSVTRLFGRVSQETRMPSTHMNTLHAQAHTVDLNVRGRSLATVELAR